MKLPSIKREHKIIAIAFIISSALYIWLIHTPVEYIPDVINEWVFLYSFPYLILMLIFFVPFIPGADAMDAPIAESGWWPIATVLSSALVLIPLYTIVFAAMIHGVGAVTRAVRGKKK